MPEFDLDSALDRPDSFYDKSLDALTPEARATFHEFWNRFQEETGATVRDGNISSVGGDPLDWNFGCNMVCAEEWADSWLAHNRAPRGNVTWNEYPPEWDEWRSSLQRVANSLASDLMLSTQLHFGYVSRVPDYGVLAFVSGTQRTNSSHMFHPRMPIRRQ